MSIEVKLISSLHLVEMDMDPAPDLDRQALDLTPDQAT
jgi:hypothetical protein